LHDLGESVRRPRWKAKSRATAPTARYPRPLLTHPASSMAIRIACPPRRQLFPRGRAQQDRNKGEVAASHAPNNGGGASRGALERASRNFASPRESGERPTREARRVRGPARKSAFAPLPSPLPACAGRGNRTMPRRRNSWISRLDQTVRRSSRPAPTGC